LHIQAEAAGSMSAANQLPASRDGGDGVVLLEADDEWRLQYRYMQTEATAEFTPAADRGHLGNAVHRGHG
jgi:hypothetical protein